MKKVIDHMGGIYYLHCEKTVNTALLAIPGVKTCVADALSGEVVCAFDETATNVEILKDGIIGAGYIVL